VGGHLTDDTIWSPDNNPYEVMEIVSDFFTIICAGFTNFLKQSVQVVPKK
jgi:hypothetical protein